MGLKNIFRFFLWSSLIDLWSISVIFVGIFIILYFKYQKLIFLLLAIISFVLIFIFNSFLNKTGSKLQEANKAEYMKNPKKYASNYLIAIIMGIPLF